MKMEFNLDAIRELVRAEIEKNNQLLLDKLKSLIQPLMQPKPQRESWSPKQVADELGLAETQTVRGWCSSGKITAKLDEFSKRWKIPNSEVERLIKNGGKP